ncbi:chromosome segregation DNA-binding protein [Arboricoccus pini]|uniref:Chromosome segregation DNA-binding protein n=1 Tax=Arboricoccus pini TaxID=1963835 RepID=A0A212RVC8_9PROT|nr:ParB/RepB/Spo0J family partition protein [Arboricoccus pini]SNB76605.1 chromosome segregation DNA-binding protein [Arboricoccus pini]
MAQRTTTVKASGRAVRSTKKAAEGPASVSEVAIASIDPHPNQPRRHIDEEALKELARSIEAHGLLQPIVLQRIGDRYQLIAGSRRLAAHGRLGRTRVPAVILPDADSDTMAMVENLHRRDLTPIEEAEGLAWLKRQRRLTLAQMHALVGKSVSYLSEIVGIANLPRAILDEARARESAGKPVPRGTLVEISRIKDKTEQARTWRKVVSSEGGKRDAARAARRPDRKPTAGANSPLAYVRDVDRFRVSLKTIDLRGKSGAHLRTSLKALRDQIDRVLAGD